MLEGLDFFEGLAVVDGVDEQKAFTGAHVLLPHGRVLLLAGSIEDVQQGDFVVDDALLAVGVCSGGNM